jgi:ATP-dependent DNA helicase RecG
LPTRYQDRSTLHSLSSLRPGIEGVVQGCVTSCRVNFGRRRSLLVDLEDDDSRLTIRLFHFSRSQQNGLEQAAWARCFGEVRAGPRGLEMVHPEYTLFDTEPEDLPAEASLRPIYPTTEGLGQNPLRSAIRQALAEVDTLAEELLPTQFLTDNNFPSLPDALRQLHEPAVTDQTDSSQNFDQVCKTRLAFEEMLAHHLAAYRARLKRSSQVSVAVPDSKKLWPILENSLDFALTGAQQNAIREISTDLSNPIPTQRLVQGDVGSGKTLVAAAACLQVIEAGYQVALMAPTEILAEQHARNFCAWFEPLGIRVAVLLGRQKVAHKREVLENLASGEIAIAVGTHALFQDEVQYAKLALVIVDEQHRFGVVQRYRFREKGRNLKVMPHQITMTATPIPRSLAMSLYADMDVTTIDELPPGRQPVETLVLPNSRRDEVLQRIESACRRGEQAYWVCPLIEESDALEAQAAIDTANYLTTSMPDISIALVHGRLHSRDKDAVMQRFRNGEIQLLVATTVIEVGVDVPNAGLMVIENSERMGLSQLHQLRGRVGRGTRQSYCVLLYQSPLGFIAKQRLTTMRKTNDGFEIAAKDLEIRGPGELLGTRQTGMQKMAVADLMRDKDLLPMVRRIAEELLHEDDETVDRLMARWIKQKSEYSNV